MVKRGPMLNAVEYYAARALVFGLSSLPFSAATWVGRRLGDLMRVVDRRHRERAREQAADRLGISGAELDEFVRKNFQSYGMTLAEFAHLSRITAEDLPRYIDTKDFLDVVGRLGKEGRGVVLLTAHFGNWEWSNSLSTMLGMGGGSIARPLDNPRVNEYVRSIRERTGLRILDKQGAIRKALRELRSGNLVGVLIDQDAGRTGIMSPFLGKTACTITIPVELAMRSGSPMVVVGLRRNFPARPGEKHFSVDFSHEVIRAREGVEETAETQRLVDACNEALSQMILRTPEQWFWIHRRWKTREPG